MKQAIKTLIEALFRVLFTYDCIGQEKVPATGPAVIAANHPSYLDPFLLGLQVRRPIHFMAWDAWFKVPLVGALMRIFDAFPVDVRKGKGREAYEKAKGLLRSGEVVGIFPEGKRSRTGWLEPALREGAARLAWETGAPLIPATISGAYRAWPHYQSLPRPARIRVRYHDPIDPGPWRAMGEDEARSVGVPLGMLRVVLFVTAGVLSAASVVVAGPVGFVGLICQHAMRLLAGPSHRVLVIGAAMAGATLVVFADAVLREIDFGSGHPPISVLTSLVGGPVLVVLLRRGRGTT